MKQHKPSHDDDNTAVIIIMIIIIIIIMMIIFQTLVPLSRINVCDQLNITTDHLIRVYYNTSHHMMMTTQQR